MCHDGTETHTVHLRNSSGHSGLESTGNRVSGCLP